MARDESFSVLWYQLPCSALTRARDVGPAIAFRAPRHRYRTPCWDNLKNLGFAIEPPANPVRPTLARRPLSATQAASDDVLIARIASRRPARHAGAVRRHHVRVFRFGLRLVRDEQIAEDLISEVFLDVWRQAGKFEGRSAVSTWLLAITRFKALSALRRRKDVELDDEAANAIEDTSDDPEVTAQKKDTSEALRKCLTALSPEHREIVDLVYYHEKSVEEVAEIVGIPENTVKTRLFYARKKLAELLKAAGVE